MTYNFDPERWLDNELAVLEFLFTSGQVNASDYHKCQDRLMDRYDKIVARLDGTYQINED